MPADPYKYFRLEARELLDGMTQVLLEIGKAGTEERRVAKLLRLTHTLKGAARAVKLTEVGELSHAMEDTLAPHRGGDVAIPAERITQLLKDLDEIAARLRAAGAIAGEAAPAAPAPGASPEEPSIESIRVEIREMDRLLEGLSEASVQTGGFEQVIRALEAARQIWDSLLRQLQDPALDGAAGARRARAVSQLRATADQLHTRLDGIRRDAEERLDRAKRELEDVGDRARRLRLVPVAAVFQSLERAVRDAGQTLGKAVELDVSGGENRLDGNVLAALQEALGHLVRNAVAHGIEPEGIRAQRGKPKKGQVRLRVTRRGARLFFSCSDDGGGIDVRATARAAVKRGVLDAPAAEALDMRGAIELLKRSKLSTATKVTEVAGRGIGMDVIRDAVQRLKGTLTLESEAGHGTTAEISVPVSLSTLDAIVVEVNGAAVAIPADAVRQAIRVPERALIQTAEGTSLLHGGESIPFVPLARLLRRTVPVTDGARHWSVLVVEAGDRSVAVGADRILSTQHVVLRSLPEMAGPVPLAAGAVMDAEGDPVLVLDAGALVHAARDTKATARASRPARRLPVLVIDDSLTTRMLEQSILEQAGYEVEVATSAEEGLERARERRYGVFIVDVEMPGMNGFDFVAHTRQDASLRETPAVLVTSLDSAEHKRRGELAGASDYIVKGEFDETRFLATIRRLVG